jgi:hypothetical protein
LLLGVSSSRTEAKANSAQHPTKCHIAAVTSAGLARGRITDRMHLNRLAPSIAAASSSSKGISQKPEAMIQEIPCRAAARTPPPGPSRRTFKPSARRSRPLWRGPSPSRT